jgi:hypothetical protein
MLNLIKYLSFVLITFLILKYYLGKLLPMKKILELTLIINLCLIIVDYFIGRNKEHFPSSVGNSPVSRNTD